MCQGQADQAGLHLQEVQEEQVAALNQFYIPNRIRNVQLFRLLLITYLATNSVFSIHYDLINTTSSSHATISYSTWSVPGIKPSRLMRARYPLEPTVQIK